MSSNSEALSRAKVLLKQLWHQHRPTIFERLMILENASASALSMDASAREEARSAAHKLAGALGTFGFSKATDWARDSEHIFIQPNISADDQQRLIDNARNIRTLLESSPD